MAKFFTVFAVPNHSDDYEVAGVFTDSDDADAFVSDAGQEGSGFLAVAHPQHLEMPVILELLVKDRLRELAEPIAKLASAMTPNVN
jgi:hypothetical protein